MIPQRCYSDIHELMGLLKTYRAEGEAGVPICYIIQKLEGIIEKWEIRDDRELEEMCRVSEGEE